MPSARPLCSGATSSDTCHRIAACCMNEPANDTKRLIQSSRKLRWRSARVSGSKRGSTRVGQFYRGISGGPPAYGLSTAYSAAITGVGHAGGQAAAHDAALQRFDLDALALRQVDQQRRTRRGRQCIDVTTLLREEIGRQRDARALGDARHFGDRFEEHRLHLRIGPEGPDRQPRRARERGERREVRELLPERAAARRRPARRGCPPRA